MRLTELEEPGVISYQDCRDQLKAGKEVPTSLREIPSDFDQSITEAEVEPEPSVSGTPLQSELADRPGEEDVAQSTATSRAGSKAVSRAGTAGRGFPNRGLGPPSSTASAAAAMAGTPQSRAASRGGIAGCRSPSHGSGCAGGAGNADAAAAWAVEDADCEAAAREPVFEQAVTAVTNATAGLAGMVAEPHQRTGEPGGSLQEEPECDDAGGTGAVARAAVIAAEPGAHEEVGTAAEVAAVALRVDGPKAATATSTVEVAAEGETPDGTFEESTFEEQSQEADAAQPCELPPPSLCRAPEGDKEEEEEEEEEVYEESYDSYTSESFESYEESWQESSRTC